MRVCKVCNECKPLGSFPRASAYKDGILPLCKACRNIRVKEYRVKTGRNKYSIRPKGTFVDKIDQVTYYKYGIYSSDVFKMFAEQKGMCKICGHGPESSRNNGHKRLAIDHCHSSKKVRGLLCMSCNTALGMLEDDTSLLLRSIEYLEQQ